MIDKRKLMISVSSVLFASVILIVVAILEHNFWWNYTSPLRDNMNLVEIVAAVKTQQATEYNTMETELEYVYNGVLYKHQTFLITQATPSAVVYIDRTSPTTVVFRQPMQDYVHVINGVILMIVGGVLCLGIRPLFNYLGFQSNGITKVKW